MAREAGRVLRICLGPAISPAGIPPTPQMEYRNELREKAAPAGRELTRSPLGKPLNFRPWVLLPGPRLAKLQGS